MMFKPTSSLQGNLRRLPLSTKQAGREYYKGNRVGSMGTIDKYGRFRPDYSKIRTFVYPVKGSKSFELTPFVSGHASKLVEEGQGKWKVPPKRITGEEYLALWKTEGGHDDVGALQQDTEVKQMNMPEVWEEPAVKAK